MGAKKMGLGIVTVIDVDGIRKLQKDPAQIGNNILAVVDMAKKGEIGEGAMVLAEPHDLARTQILVRIGRSIQPLSTDMLAENERLLRTLLNFLDSPRLKPHVERLRRIPA